MTCNLEQIKSCPKDDCPFKLIDEDFVAYIAKLLEDGKSAPEEEIPSCIYAFLGYARMRGMRIQLDDLKLGYRGK